MIYQRWDRSAVQGMNYQDQVDCIKTSKLDAGHAWWWDLTNICDYPIIAGSCVKSGDGRVKPSQLCDPNDPNPTEIDGILGPRVTTTTVLGPLSEAPVVGVAYTRMTLSTHEYWYWAFTCVP